MSFATAQPPQAAFRRSARLRDARIAVQKEQPQSWRSRPEPVMGKPSLMGQTRAVTA